MVPSSDEREGEFAHKALPGKYWEVLRGASRSFAAPADESDLGIAAPTPNGSQGGDRRRLRVLQVHRNPPAFRLRTKCRPASHFLDVDVMPTVHWTTTL